MSVGQLEYHASNTLFLSGNAIVLLVVDLAKTKKDMSLRRNEVVFWLSALNATAELHNLPPLNVLMVGTHVDEMKQNDLHKEGLPWLSEGNLKQLPRFAHIRIESYWHALNARTSGHSSFTKLRQALQTLAESITRGMRVPSSIVAIQKWVDAQRSSICPVLSINELRTQIRVTLGIVLPCAETPSLPQEKQQQPPSDECDQMIHIMHQLGLVLHIRQSTPELVVIKGLRPTLQLDRQPNETRWSTTGRCEEWQRARRPFCDI